jgi:hypothetical protein
MNIYMCGRPEQNVLWLNQYEGGILPNDVCQTTYFTAESTESPVPDSYSLTPIPYDSLMPSHHAHVCLNVHPSKTRLHSATPVLWPSALYSLKICKRKTLKKTQTIVRVVQSKVMCSHSGVLWVILLIANSQVNSPSLYRLFKSHSEMVKGTFWFCQKKERSSLVRSLHLWVWRTITENTFTESPIQRIHSPSPWLSSSSYLLQSALRLMLRPLCYEELNMHLVHETGSLQVPKRFGTHWFSHREE